MTIAGIWVGSIRSKFSEFGEQIQWIYIANSVNLFAFDLAESQILLTFAAKTSIMPIHYRLLQNQIKGSKNYRKYYAHTVRQGVINMEDIEQMIQENCTAKASDVRLVLRELYDAIKFYMQHGYTVDLKELGKFSISVKSVCVDSPEDFNSKTHITGFKCNYTPQGKRRHSSDPDANSRIHRGLLDGCEAVETKFYK